MKTFFLAKKKIENLKMIKVLDGSLKKMLSNASENWLKPSLDGGMIVDVWQKQVR